MGLRCTQTSNTFVSTTECRGVEGGGVGAGGWGVILYNTDSQAPKTAQPGVRGFRLRTNLNSENRHYLQIYFTHCHHGDATALRYAS